MQAVDIRATGSFGCPKCGISLDTLGEIFYCASCGTDYPMTDGMPDFAPWTVQPTGLGQRFMENRHVINIYETRLWRGSLLFRLATGIWIEDEIALVSRILSAGPEDTLLDVSCGTGLYTRAFAAGHPERKVIGLDICPPMLEYASAKAGKLGLANISFVRGDAHFLPFQDASLDAVNCAGALHLLRDPNAAIAEASRVIKPGGRYSVAVFWHSDSPVGRMQAWFDQKVLGIHSFSASELAQLFDAAGFDTEIHHAKGTWLIAVGRRR